jgi:protein required for attachment to host cells
VDSRRGRLWRGEPAPEGHYHLEEVDAITSTWEEHQHGRPSPLASKDGHTHAAWRHEEETMMHHFAKDVVTWLERQVDRREIEHLHVFAAPRFLGELRRVRSDRLAARLEEHEAELVPMEVKHLMEHPAVHALRWHGSVTA